MINVQNLKFGYRKNQTVLEDLNLELTPGHIYGLLGTNSAGKSTLIHLLAGLLFAREGRCDVLGESPSGRSPQFLQQIFLLAEDLNVPNISIRSYKEIYAPFYPAFSHELFDRFLHEFMVPAESKFQELSYGQKKKVMISFALATQAKILLMDEPTNGLDIPSKKKFRKIIAGVIREDQLIIISTHQVKDLDSLIDYVLILEDKKIVIHETIERITEKLLFKQVMNLTEINDVIYSEDSLKGHAVVVVNSESEPSRFDMEMFFNAVLTEKQQIIPLFNS